MRRWRNRPLCAALVLTTLGQTAWAQPADDVDRSLQAVRERIRAGEHEGAIEAAQSAKAAVEAGTPDPARLAQAHLLLALSYVNYGNFQANEHRPMAAEMLYKEARAALAAGFAIPELRRAQLDRGEWPPELIELFARVRAEMFGGLRIIALEPADALVTLDGAPLDSLPGEAVRGDAAVAVGPHTIAVERPGYRTQTETITIAPNSWQERPYRLVKKRGRRFYALVGTGVLAVAGGVVALVGGSGGAAPPLAPLPGPPPPPAR
jgi:hypothetical protein